ncbi:cupin domain-containing protein [Amylibacter sp.]|nr:cupin domain-containing protein [Amylibacter sp.]
MSKSPPRVNRFADLTFNPRFEYGDQAAAVQICGPDDMSELAAGFGRLTNARFAWTIKYDEIIIVLEGELTIYTGGETLTAGKHDSIWLPAGTELEYAAKDALISFAIHPANWADT